MTMKRSWSMTTVFAIGLALLAVLSARARDNDKRLDHYQVCEDINASPSNDQFSYLNCLEGHGCVICFDLNHADIGEVTVTTGPGVKKWHPQAENCAGDRVFGICTASGNDPSFCDTSTYFVSGQCGGAMLTFEDQRLDQIAGGP